MNNLMVMTQIAGRRCALHAHDVQSVIELGDVTPVPQTPEFIAGITALRSQALTVIDCRLALGFEQIQWDTDTRAAVVSIAGFLVTLPRSVTPSPSSTVTYRTSRRASANQVRSQAALARNGRALRRA